MYRLTSKGQGVYSVACHYYGRSGLQGDPGGGVLAHVGLQFRQLVSTMLGY